jgi:hypothetical protein
MTKTLERRFSAGFERRCGCGDAPREVEIAVRFGFGPQIIKNQPRRLVVARVERSTWNICPSSQRQPYVVVPALMNFCRLRTRRWLPEDSSNGYVASHARGGTI